MFAQITKILLCLALCLGLLSCPMHPPDYKCIEWQDVAAIEAHYGTIFDNLVVRKDDKVVRCCYRGSIHLIGSKTHKAEFPIHINTQLFLHETLLQSLDFEMPENSILFFYQRSDCEMLYDSTDTFYNSSYKRKDQFYRDVQKAIDNGAFIDSSSSEIACWMMERMTDVQDARCIKEIEASEDNDWLNCIKKEHWQYEGTY